MHYIGLGFGTGKLEEEEGLHPPPREYAEQEDRPRIVFSLVKLKAMSALVWARRSDGLSSQRHWQPATIFC